MSSEGSRTFVSLVFLTKNSRPEYDGKGHDPLSRMDRDSANVCRAGRPGHQQAVGFVLKMRMGVRVVDVFHDVRRIEQDHDVVSQKADGINAEFVL